MGLIPDSAWADWMQQARDAGAYYWAYRDFVDDNPDGARAAFEAGIDPREYIKDLGIELDLHEFGPAWGSW